MNTLFVKEPRVENGKAGGGSAMNREGIPGPFGRIWGDITIRGCDCWGMASSTTSFGLRPTQSNAMRQEFGWDRSAHAYAELYRGLAGAPAETEMKAQPKRASGRFDSRNCGYGATVLGTWKPQMIPVILRQAMVWSKSESARLMHAINSEAVGSLREKPVAIPFLMFF